MPTELDPRPHLSEARSWLSAHRAAATVVGGLTAASLLLWGGLVVVTGSGATDPATRGQQAGAPSAIDAPAGDATDPGAPTADPDPTPDPTPDPDPMPDPDDLSPELVAQPEPLDPDDHAPLDPTDAGERWVVVLASYTRSSAAERDLGARAADEDAALLWSSHYGGLTPELWVVFTGPFPDREAALDAADTVGGDAYARELAPPADG